MRKTQKIEPDPNFFLTDESFGGSVQGPLLLIHGQMVLCNCLMFVFQRLCHAGVMVVLLQFNKHDFIIHTIQFNDKLSLPKNVCNTTMVY